MAEKVIQLSVKVNAETGQLDVLGAQFKGISEKATKAGGSFKGLAGEAGNLAKSFAPFLTGAGIVAFFASAVKGAEEENEAIRRLSFGLQASGVSWEDNKEAVLQWGAAIQATTRFSDTEALSTLDRLVRVTGNLTQAQAGSQLAMGLSVASGKSLSETEAVMVDLLNGNERALIAVNKEFGAFTGGAKTTQEALDILQAKLGDAAMKEESFTKGTAGLKNAFGEFSETVGRAFIPALTTITTLATGAIGIFENLGTVIANIAAKALVAAQGITSGLFRAIRLDFDGVKRAFEQMGQQFDAIEEASVAMVTEAEAKKTAVISTAEAERLIAKKQKHDAEEEERQKQLALVEQTELELNQRLAGIGEETFQKKKNMLDAEMAARAAKISREITGEQAKEKLLAKLGQEHLARTNILTRAEVKIKTDAAFKVASDAITALQILNSMQEGHTKEEARRAKILLALQQAIAIANLWRAEAGKGVVGIALAAAGTAVILAQFAQQSKAIDQARSAASQGQSQLQVTTPLPGGGNLNENLPGAAGAPGVAGGGAGFGGGGGGGAGGTTVINVGGVTVNLPVDHLDLSNVEVVARRLAEFVRSGVSDGINLAVTMKNVGDKNATRAV